MSAVMFVFAFIWLVWGLIEWRTAITHAKLYKYSPPVNGASKWVLCFATGAFLIGIYTS